jgi:hypothetical protein
MGEPGGGHQLTESGGVDAVPAEFRRGGLDDPTPRLGGFEFRFLHPGAPPKEASGGSHPAAVIVF